MINTEEYKQGEQAYQEGKTTRNNPYPIGSEAGWLWQEGYFGNGDKRQNNGEVHRVT